MHPQTKWRQKTGVSQQRLSRATGPTREEIKAGAKEPLGVDQGLISKLEKGDHLPGLETAMRLCIATARLSKVVEPLRIAQYAPRELALTYSQTMEDWYGLAEGTAAQAADRGGDESKRRYAEKTAQEAVSITYKRARTRGKSGRKRKATKAAKAAKAKKASR